MKLNLPKEATFQAPAATWKRIFAFVMDLLLVDFIVMIPFLKYASKLEGSLVNLEYVMQDPSLTSLVLFIFAVRVLMALIYFSVLEYKFGQTVGKMLLNIKVETLTKKPSFPSYLIRSMFLLTVPPFILLWILDPIFMIFTKQKRRFSEILSKTRTVESINLR